MSKTPRVDHAENLVLTNEQQPAGYVRSSVAKHLEIELNQALADLKAAQNLLEKLNSSLNLKNTEQIAPSVTTEEHAVPSPSVIQAVELTSAPDAKLLQGRDINKNRADEIGAASAQVITPTPSPKSVGDSVEYADGQILFNKGDNAKHLAIVLEGSVEIFDPIGNVSLANLGAGCAFGEQAILEGGVRDASVRALGNVKCLEINTESLRVDLMKNKGLLRQTIEGLLLQLSMCNQISKMISKPKMHLVYELPKNERLTTIQIQNKLRDAFDNPDSRSLPAEQMMYLKLQSSEKLMSHWFKSGKVLGSPSMDSIGSAYVITEGSVEAQCGDRSIRLGCGSVLGLAEGITGEPFSWTLVARENLTVKVISIAEVLRDLKHSNIGIKGIVRYTTSRILELKKTFNQITN
jgi:CRP/FNR family cyclic AMP-dependent transcriptional regulator